MQIECTECESIFTLKWKEDEVDGTPTYCPFCSATLDIDPPTEDSDPEEIEPDDT